MLIQIIEPFHERDFVLSFRRDLRGPINIDVRMQNRRSPFANAIIPDRSRNRNNPRSSGSSIVRGYSLRGPNSVRSRHHYFHVGKNRGVANRAELLRHPSGPERRTRGGGCDKRFTIAICCAINNANLLEIGNK